MAYDAEMVLEANDALVVNKENEDVQAQSEKLDVAVCEPEIVQAALSDQDDVMVIKDADAFKA